MSVPLNGVSKARLIFPRDVVRVQLTAGETDALCEGFFSRPLPMMRAEGSTVTPEYPGTWFPLRQPQPSQITLNPSVAWDIEMRNANYLVADLSSVDLLSFRLEGSEYVDLVLNRPHGTRTLEAGGVRVAKLAESLSLLKALLAGQPASSAGPYYPMTEAKISPGPLHTSGVDPRDAGVAAATLNTAQQVGASLGAALLNTFAATATAAYLAANPTASRAQALVHGYAAAATWGAAVLICGALLAAWLIASGRPLPASRPV